MNDRWMIKEKKKKQTEGQVINSTAYNHYHNQQINIQKLKTSVILSSLVCKNHTPLK